MIRTVHRFEMVLTDSRNLRRSMRYKRHTLRSLADEVTRELRKSRDKDAVKTVSKSTIGYLTNGTQKITKPEIAAAIEEVLDVAPGTLFTQRVSTVSRESARQQQAGMVGLYTALFGLAFVTAVVLGIAWVVSEYAAILTYAEQAGGWISRTAGTALGLAGVVVSPHMIVQRMTVAQAAEAACRSKDTIYTALEDGTLHGSQRCKGGRWLIRPACLEAWLDGGKCEHQAEQVQS